MKGLRVVVSEGVLKEGFCLGHLYIGCRIRYWVWNMESKDFESDVMSGGGLEKTQLEID